MSYRTVNDTAAASDGDYIAKIGTLNFAPGQTTKSITIEVKGNSDREANDTSYLDRFGQQQQFVVHQEPRPRHITERRLITQL